MPAHDSTSDEQSAFTEVSEALALGDQAAAAEMWDRYAARLIALARRNLSRRIRQKEDPDDVVQSALKSFYRRHANGTLKPHDWDGVWAVLVVMTLRKCRNRVRTYRTASRALEREVPLAEAAPASTEPTPAEAAVLSDLVVNLMASLDDDRQRQILMLALQGFGATEIGAQVGRTRRTVHRVLDRVRKRLTRIETDGEENH